MNKAFFLLPFLLSACGGITDTIAAPSQTSVAQPSQRSRISDPPKLEGKFLEDLKVALLSGWDDAENAWLISSPLHDAWDLQKWSFNAFVQEQKDFVLQIEGDVHLSSRGVKAADHVIVATKEVEVSVTREHIDDMLNDACQAYASEQTLPVGEVVTYELQGEVVKFYEDPWFNWHILLPQWPFITKKYKQKCVVTRSTSDACQHIAANAPECNYEANEEDVHESQWIRCSYTDTWTCNTYVQSKYLASQAPRLVVLLSGTQEGSNPP